ncbi:MAG: tRNA lysidine(34) synthetase TilS [Phycisphaerae bacterium]|nr:tRNA lysidine(34) synthetase TilS [Phycisphaerae bacterium]
MTVSDHRTANDSRLSNLLREVSREPLTGLVAANLTARCRVGAAQQPVVVGASGGPDSSALVLVLAALARRRVAGPEPIIVCVHHGLRAEADEECAMTARLARRLGLPFERVDIRPALRPGNLSANARDERYAALRAAAIRNGAALVATAHHADDRLETMLLALARGRGLRGLATPRWGRSLGEGVRLVRPLLNATKQQCVALCERVGVASATDPSNADSSRARGHLRNAVLPALLSRYPGLAKHASSTADEAAIALRALESMAKRRFGEGSRWKRRDFSGADLTLTAWVFRRAAFRIDAESALLVPRRGWEQMARAAVGDGTRPRTFEWSHRIRGIVTLEHVALETQTKELRLL